MPSVTQAPDGAYLIQRDDGSSFRSPVPPSGMAPPQAEAAPVAAEPPAQAPSGPRIVDDMVHPLTGDRVYMLEYPDGRRVPAPEGTVSGAGLEEYERAKAGKAPAQPLPAEDTRPLGSVTGVSPAVLEATRKARGLPEEPQPSSVFGMGVGGGMAGAAWSGINTASPPPAPPAAPEKKQEPPSLDSFFAQPGSAPASAQSQMTIPSFRPAGPTDLGEKGLREAAAQAQKAIAAREGYERAKAVGDAAYMEEAAAQQDKLQAQAQQREAERRVHEESAVGKLQSFMDDANKPDGKVDPGRWWASRETGQKIAAVLGQALLGFSAGLAGRPAPMVISDFIDQDIALQREALAQKGEQQQRAIQNQGMLLGAMRQQYGDERQAEAAAKAAAWDRVEKQLALNAAKFKGQEAGVRAQEALAAVSEKKAQAVSDLRVRSAQLALQQQAAAREDYAFKLQMAAKQMGQQQYPPNTPPEKLPEEVRKRWVPGVGAALDEDAAKKLRDQKGASEEVLSLMDRLKGLRDKYGGELVNRSAVAEYRSLLAQLKMKANKAGGLGALDNGTMEVLGEVYGADASDFGGSFDAKLSAARKSVTDGFLASATNLTGRKPTTSSFRPEEK